MKNRVIVVAVVVILAAFSFAADNSSLPSPDFAVSFSNVMTQAITSRATAAPGEGGPLPICQPGHNCDGSRQIAGEGAPLRGCQPGYSCGDQVRPVG